MTTFFAGIGVVTSLVLILGASVSNALAGMRVVNCNGGQTIQSAVGSALDGDVIEVSGACVESVIIEKNRIRLKANPGATLTALGGSSHAIIVRGLNIRITDFSSISGGDNVIHVQRGGSAEIVNNTIENGGRGILVNQNAYVRIEGNVIRNNTNDTGITVRQGASASIFRNTITGNVNQGIRVDDAGLADIDGNIITQNATDGIFIRLTSHVRLSGQPDFGEPNLLEGNGRWGLLCLENSSIKSRAPQDFGTGNGVGSALLSGCTVNGSVF